MRVFKREKFKEIYEYYQGPLIRFIYGYVYDLDKAKDIVQETFLRLHKEKKEIYNLQAWIFKVARNIAIDHIRKEKRMLRMGEDYEYEDKKEHHRRARIRHLLEREISQLTLAYRETFILRDVEGYSYEEIAEILGIAEGTAKSRVFRSREILRKRLKDELRRI